ncbi:MAG: hypothetical protein JO042_09150 [Sinobacteraceae bacterium]|nr:hypothetical protein [Nevskiaceae bacterium]
MDDQFERGLKPIRDLLESEVRQKRFRSVAVSHTLHGSPPCPVTFKVAADGKTSEQKFTREEIEDSAGSIEHSAHYKVSQLMERFK